jgi:hypothetical protein
MHPFWLIWTTITAAAVIAVAWAVGHVPRSEEATKRPINLILTWRQVETARAVVALTLLAVFLASYIATILAWEDFAHYDNSLFHVSTLKGHDLSPFISRGTGRFLPLLFQEFNLTRHFTDTATGYHVLPIAQLLIFSYILLILDAELSITARAALAILVLLTPSIFMSFSSLEVSAERNVLFFLACLVLCIKYFEQTQSIGWAVATVVCAQFVIYCKETAFLLLLGLAAARVILRCRNGRYAGWDYDRLWSREGRLDLCLASLAVLYLLFYLAVMGIHGNVDYENYAHKFQRPLAEIELSYLRVDLLAWVFVAVVLGRIYLILRHRAAPLLLWDGLAFGGVACFLAYQVLRLFSAYYLAPVDLIAVLYVGRFAVLSWGKMRSGSKVAALMLAFTVVLQAVLVSTLVAFERKNAIHAKVEIASVVETRYRSGGGNALRLFFPFSNPYVIAEFGSYLNYRGVPVEGAVSEAAELNSVVLATRAVANDAPCVSWMGIRCHRASGPAPGDLVIVLPDDEASLVEASMYRERGELLFSYEPHPPIPDWVYLLVGGLPIATPKYTHKTRPDRWMDGSVAIWK